MVDKVQQLIPSFIFLALCLIGLTVVFVSYNAANRLRKNSAGQVNSLRVSARDFWEKRGVKMNCAPQHKVTGYYDPGDKVSLINAAQADAQDMISLNTVGHEGGHAADHERIGDPYRLLDHRPQVICVTIAITLLSGGVYPLLTWATICLQGLYFALNLGAEWSASRWSEKGLESGRFLPAELKVSQKYNAIALTNYAGMFSGAFFLCLALASIASVTHQSFISSMINSTSLILQTLL